MLILTTISQPFLIPAFCPLLSHLQEKVVTRTQEEALAMIEVSSLSQDFQGDCVIVRNTETKI